MDRTGEQGLCPARGLAGPGRALVFCLLLIIRKENPGRRVSRHLSETARALRYDGSLNGEVFYVTLFSF